MFYKIPILLCLCFSSIAFGVCQGDGCLDGTVRVSYRYAIDRIFRKIYYPANYNFGIEIASNLYYGLGPFVGLDISAFGGKTLFEHEATWYTEVPLSFGLRYLHYFTPCFQTYFQGAAVMSTVVVNNDSPYLDNIIKRGVGALGRIGIKYHLTEYLCFDIFGDSTWLEIDFASSVEPVIEGRKADLSHIKAGGGLTIWY